MFGFFEPPPFVPERDIPSLQGQTILVTGGNSGLGKEQILLLAKYGKPSKLYLAARSAAKAEAAIQEIEAAVPGAKILFHELDLSSLAKVKASADAFLRANSRLDILVNNAGIMAHPAGLSEDGYEVQFATNHMGHFLFTRELLPLLTRTATTASPSPSSSNSSSSVRIINLSSGGHMFAPKGGFLPDACKTDMKEYITWTRYGQSKLANILFTKELARRYPQITSVSIHPGAVGTNLSSVVGKSYPGLDYLFGWAKSYVIATPAVGTLTQTWASVAALDADDTNSKGDKAAVAGNPPRVKQGEYYQPVAALGTRSSYAKDEELAKKLWDWSEAEVVAKGY